MKKRPASITETQWHLLRATCHYEIAVEMFRSLSRTAPDRLTRARSVLFWLALGATSVEKHPGTWEFSVGSTERKAQPAIGGVTIPGTD